MIIIRLWGGLGNQMFQYAVGYALAQRRNDSLALDTRFFTEAFIQDNPRFTKQKLNIFEFPLEIKNEVNRNGEYRKICAIQKKLPSRLIRIPRRFHINIDGIHYEKETRLTYLPYIESISSDNIYLDGYWQCEEYFRDYHDDIRKQFILKSVPAQEYVAQHFLNQGDAVSLHMRLGDYANSRRIFAQTNSQLGPGYYRRAIQAMKKKLATPRFFVFSNDIQKARTILGASEEFVYVNENRLVSDLDEFEVMRQCSHHIISNSTFSWWAAWLGDSLDSINIAPNTLFGNDRIIPDRWELICVD